MKAINKLIALVCKYNDFILINSMMLKPMEVLLYCTKDNEDEGENLKTAIVANCPQTRVELQYYDNFDYVQGSIDVLDISQMAYCVHFENSMEQLLLIRYAFHRGLKLVYTDIKNEKLQVITYDENNILNLKFAELDIGDYMLLSNNTILRDSKNLYNNPDIVKLVKIISTNHLLWKAAKRALFDLSKVSSASSINYISLNTSRINEPYRTRFAFFMDILNKEMLIENYIIDRNIITFNFISFEIRDFVLKFGSWFEALTYYVVKDVKDLDDANCGVVFLWKDESGKIKNEIDVMAAVDSQLVCISCKDTKDIDSETINEIIVYGNRIGGKNSKKLLVISETPYRKELIQKAQELGVQVIIFKGDVEVFSSELKVAIENRV